MGCAQGVASELQSDNFRDSPSRLTRCASERVLHCGVVIETDRHAFSHGTFCTVTCTAVEVTGNCDPLLTTEIDLCFSLSPDSDRRSVLASPHSHAAGNMNDLDHWQECRGIHRCFHLTSQHFLRFVVVWLVHDCHGQRSQVFALLVMHEFRTGVTHPCHEVELHWRAGRCRVVPTVASVAVESDALLAGLNGQSRNGFQIPAGEGAHEAPLRLVADAVQTPGARTGKVKRLAVLLMQVERILYNVSMHDAV